MGKVRFQVAVSLDGYMAGPNQTLEEPLGVGGEDLHRCMIELEVWRRIQGQEGGIVNASTAVVEGGRANVGAYVMGRNMFGGGPGAWRDDPPWKGWWGDDPPYHASVFVLKHYARECLPMQGGTTFHFVTGGIESAMRLAKEAAAPADVAISGGANVVQQALAARMGDEFELHLALDPARWRRAAPQEGRRALARAVPGNRGARRDASHVQRDRMRSTEGGGVRGRDPNPKPSDP